MRGLSICALFCSLTLSSVEGRAAPIDAQTLLQYQYNVDAIHCHTTLANGLQVELSGLFANEQGGVRFYEIVNIGLKTDAHFGFAELVAIEGGGMVYPAKVSKLEDGIVFFSLGSEFLNDLWGSEVTFIVRNAGGKNAYLSLPAESEEARFALSRLRTCYTEALNAD